MDGGGGSKKKISDPSEKTKKRARVGFDYTRARGGGPREKLKNFRTATALKTIYADGAGSRAGWAEGGLPTTKFSGPSGFRVLQISCAYINPEPSGTRGTA